MDKETEIKVRSIENLANTVDLIWTDVMSDIVAGSLDIRRVWDMNDTISELRERVDKLLEEVK